MTLFIQQLLNGLTVGSLYALIAVGYTVVYGIVQLINFAHGEVFMIGAFGSLATWQVVCRSNTGLWVLPIMIVGGAVCSVVVALLMERFAYRPLRNAPRLAPLITAIGISIALQRAIQLWYPGATSNVSYPSIDGVTGSSLTIGSVVIQRTTLFTLGVLIVSAAALYIFISRTRTGKAMVAVSQDPDTARLMGINVDRIIAAAFAMGAILAALAGVAQGLRDSNVSSTMGFLAGLKAFTAAVLGGIGNIQGAVAGGLVLGLIEAMATQYIPGQFGGNAWSDVYAFIVLILVLVFRPQGLFGARVVDRA
ncbi:branched-chain amino acid ABC transporter permease [Allobranchiibius sp. GilTou73]|uniref:branched-chain amino acid ABC transporter permease n=1 Tax=Allobranchiibius sp. GilTou73 TaxID=2904523 RepID=UPI001F2E2616|nr:branched-chain amino acid ABC transporter permease [Allobranchiibius sp. GilTou73]UIJ34096.1 branched-chain amino acid ABC transporter permease [Allobranchiibius sp. GilTou73]